ncbi:MAG: hypothetical protein IPN47_23560 [Gemmatimonadetes bacterium]|nr:hypothetical protein [Gemmatimonadota bacterium]
MVDIARSALGARGRGSGEDPYLGSVMAAAQCAATQRNDLRDSLAPHRQRQALRSAVAPPRGARLQHDRYPGAYAAGDLSPAVPAAVNAGRDR